jgi:uncharacterized membrane protein YeaQ/YmgE (transglycosylase-associated protein family)
MVVQRNRRAKRALVLREGFWEEVPAGCGSQPRTRSKGRGIVMGLLGWLIVGLIAGILAKWVVPGEGPGGLIGDIIVGIVGAFIGGWVFNFFGHTGVTGVNVGSIVVAFIGAVILLFIMRAFSGRRSVV